MREAFDKVTAEDMEHPALIAVAVNHATDSRQRHKNQFNEKIKDVRNDLGEIKLSIDKLTEKMQSFSDYMHKLELNQVKVWVKITALSATMGGAGYFLAHWIKGIK